MSHFNRYNISCSLVLSAQATEYKGTCHFNSLKMPCSVSQNPFTLTMRWADGVTETYVHQGNGIFTDKRGGIWTSNPNVKDGILLNHKNGNQVGFVENR
jgi:hypothetical protein